MQKKLMAVAVAGAFAAPALALAQNASTVQISGKLYWEYSWASQGSQGSGNVGPAVATPLAGGTWSGDLPRVDRFQTPGSQITFKGEEKLGGSLSAWFQCESTFDFRGQGPQGLCGRNSALGLKGSWGNIFAGMWDTPFKRTIDIGRVGGNDTGIFGTAGLMTGNSASTISRASPMTWKRRQTNSITYESPNFSGFQVLGMVSVLSNNDTIASGMTSTVPGVKPRLFSLGASYVNGPLQLGAAYELHQNFWTTPNAATGLVATMPSDGKDHAWHISGAYTFFGALKVGASYAQMRHDVAVAGPAPIPFLLRSADIDTMMVGADWKISGPHGLKGNWTHAFKTKGDLGGAAGGPLFPAGTCSPTLVGGMNTDRVFNCGQGGTAADLYQIQYYYTFSKRTVGTIGYVYLNNDKYARYSLGGLTTPAGGQNQSALGMSLTHTF